MCRVNLLFHALFMYCCLSLFFREHLHTVKDFSRNLWTSLSNHTILCQFKPNIVRRFHSKCRIKTGQRLSHFALCSAFSITDENLSINAPDGGRGRTEKDKRLAFYIAWCYLVDVLVVIDGPG